MPERCRQLSATSWWTYCTTEICIDNSYLLGYSNIDGRYANGKTSWARRSKRQYAFSGKFESFEAAVALHFAYYNFVSRHNTLRANPAMAAGIERDFWTTADLVKATA